MSRQYKTSATRVIAQICDVLHIPLEYFIWNWLKPFGFKIGDEFIAGSYGEFFFIDVEPDPKADDHTVASILASFHKRQNFFESDLSKREITVLDKMARPPFGAGKRAYRAAADLNITPQAVNIYLSRLKTKFYRYFPKMDLNFTVTQVTVSTREGTGKSNKKKK